MKAKCDRKNKFIELKSIPTTLRPESSRLINRLVSILSIENITSRMPFETYMPHIAAHPRTVSLSLSLSFFLLFFYFFFNVVSRRCFFFVKFEHWGVLRGVKRERHGHESRSLRCDGFHESISRSIWRVLLPRNNRTGAARQTYGVVCARTQRYVFAPANRLLNTRSRYIALISLIYEFHTFTSCRTFDKNLRQSSAAVAFAHTRWVEIVGAPVSATNKHEDFDKSRFEDLA